MVLTSKHCTNRTPTAATKQTES